MGVDETNGRYGEVEILTCVSCGRPWLRYFVEYEAFSRSGRWARGLVSPDVAGEVTPETALVRLSEIGRFIRGGSYFDGGPVWVSGRPWGM